MKIAASNVEMMSTRQALRVDQSTTLFNVRMERSKLEEENAFLNKKEEDPLKELGRTAKDAKTDNKSQEESNKKREEEQKAAIIEISDKGRNSLEVSKSSKCGIPSAEELSDASLETLRSLLRMLRSLGGNSKALERLEKFINNQADAAKDQKKQTTAINGGMLVGVAVAGNVNRDRNDGITTVTQRSEFHAESEFTSFNAKGKALTEDGRSIDFGVELSMSREFMSYAEINEENVMNLKDPLVINLKGGAAVTDQKFTFDIDADGKEDNISRLTASSGFLAYDRNGNGRVDDGNELFGTKSGDGFKDLKAFDQDKNGWIDENDDIFSKLKVWFKDEDGTDRLLSLKEADVGAIFLGKSDTEFSLKNNENKTDAVIRSTGIFLKESGGAGTIQHLDLAL
ncbi:MAG: hypothetical protein K6F99_00090 [Lachnospiraceae bacterium]|nr:hypothetical protein [Lachnospiraceae bacterium]